MGNEQSTQKKRQKANPAETKVQNGELNGHVLPPADLPTPVANKEAIQQNIEIPPVADTKEPKPSAGKEETDSKKDKVPDKVPAHVETTPEKEMTAATKAEPTKEAPKPTGEEVTSFFGKMFKKIPEPVKSAAENKDSVDGQVTAADLKNDLQPEPVDVNSSTKPDPEPEGEALKPSPEKPTEENNPSQEDKAVEKTVMNFFKTFASSTKTSKEGKATGDASKEQSQKETPPAPSTNVQEAPKAPPPPPPAPPKMESKAEPAVKKEEATASASAAATKAAEGSSKTKSFSKLFRPKVLLGKVVSKVHSATSGASGPAKTSGVHVVVEEKKPVEVQVDASKTSTLEAAAKPEEPPAPKPKPEEKKPEKKSAFGGLFKPKVLLGQMSARIQAAASSAAASVSLVSAGSAPEPKKESPAPPAVAETAPVVKAKEEPKPAAPAPAAPDNKSVESTDNASPSTQRKLEKRNSIQLFFKTLVK